MRTLMLFCLVAVAIPALSQQRDTVYIKIGDTLNVVFNGRDLVVLMKPDTTWTIKHDTVGVNRIDSIYSWVSRAVNTDIPEQRLASAHEWKASELQTGGVATQRATVVTDANVWALYYNNPAIYVVDVIRLGSNNNTVYYRTKP